MRLGIAYIVFEGFELLEPAILSIRSQVDFITAIYQKISYYGQKADPTLIDVLENLKNKGLIDELVLFNSNLSEKRQVNETAARNLGRETCFLAKCSHHISADVDEFYLPSELEYAKKSMDGYDTSVVSMDGYFKDPTFKFTKFDQIVSFIQSIEIGFDRKSKFKYLMDNTRRPDKSNNCKVFSREEITIHHMSYVRKDMRRKIENSLNWEKVDREKFLEEYNKYCLGDKIRIPPGFISKRTKFAPDIFNIKEFIK